MRLLVDHRTVQSSTADARSFKSHNFKMFIIVSNSNQMILFVFTRDLKIMDNCYVLTKEGTWYSTTWSTHFRMRSWTADVLMRSRIWYTVKTIYQYEARESGCRQAWFELKPLNCALSYWNAVPFSHFLYANFIFTRYRYQYHLEFLRTTLIFTYER
jgi:hypothetical protein